MNCGALILAAGSSSRLGHPKQLIHLEGETLLERSVRIAKEAGCSPVVVVLGAFGDLIRNQCNLLDALIVFNPDWAEGMGTSLSCGVGIFEGDVPGIVVMTCDMPSVTADHLRSLASSGVMTASSYADRRGVPAYFPCEVFPELSLLSGDSGAKNLLRSAEFVALPGGTFDIDTPADLSDVSE